MPILSDHPDFRLAFKVRLLFKQHAIDLYFNSSGWFAFGRVVSRQVKWCGAVWNCFAACGRMSTSGLSRCLENQPFSHLHSVAQRWSQWLSFNRYLRVAILSALRACLLKCRSWPGEQAPPTKQWAILARLHFLQTTRCYASDSMFPGVVFSSLLLATRKTSQRAFLLFCFFFQLLTSSKFFLIRKLD